MMGKGNYRLGGQITSKQFLDENGENEKLMGALPA
jgi:hypothetical protein